MRPPARLSVLFWCLGFGTVALIGKAVQVQVVHRELWKAKALRQQTVHRAAPLFRGQITDLSGHTLAYSTPQVEVAFAPRDINQPQRLRGIFRQLGLGPDALEAITDTSRAWVRLPGRFDASRTTGLTNLRGVSVTPVMTRVDQAGSIRKLLGHVDLQGHGLDGMERKLDTLLRGTPARGTLYRDARGRIVANDAGMVPAVPGASVQLTLDFALQRICDSALAEAVGALHADGGDIVVMDPSTGEIRAMSSLRSDPVSTVATPLAEPYEPGSTLKPITAAALLRAHKAAPDERITTFSGVYTTNGRTIHDEHPAESMTLREVIAKSSNIGIVRFAERLTPSEEFENLQAFGLGATTGLPYPVESRGRLPGLARWSRQSPASLAMGYELSVTPVQLAVAYSVIANGGELIAPSLIRRIESAEGGVLYEHTPEVVRRVISPEDAAAIRLMLSGVVSSGTGAQASLANYDVGGKTGTARRNVNGHYIDKQYVTSFVGLFPAERPQYVLVVKLDNPTGGYAASTAAPLARTILERGIASPAVVLDREALLAQAHPPRANADSLRGQSYLATLGSHSPDSTTRRPAHPPLAATAAAFTATARPAKDSVPPARARPAAAAPRTPGIVSSAAGTLFP